MIDVCITHVYMYQGQGSKAKYTCIIHACIRIMYKCARHASYICAPWPRVSGSRIYASYILLLESPCPLVRPEQNFSRIIHTCNIVKYQGSWMYASYINTSCTCIMIKEHMCMHHAYMHHVYMHQSQGLSMHDKYAAS